MRTVATALVSARARALPAAVGAASAVSACVLPVAAGMASAAAITSAITRCRSALARPPARLRAQITEQALTVLGITPGPLRQLGIGRDEGQVEQLRIRFLLGVDPLLLVTLEGRGLLYGVEHAADEKALV